MDSDRFRGGNPSQFPEDLVDVTLVVEWYYLFPAYGPFFVDYERHALAEAFGAQHTVIT